METEETPAALTQVINAEYLEFYSLAESPDANHKIRIAGPDGKTWHRSESPGIDLTHIDVRETYKHPPLKTSEDTYLAYLWLKRQHMDTFYQWIRQLVGKPIGVVLRGELVQVLVVEDLVRTQTIAIEFPTYDEAMRDIKRIGAGGMSDIQKTQPGDGEEGSWGTKAGSQPAISSSAEDLITSLQVFTTLVEMDEKESKQTRVMACLLNHGDQPVRIYKPGLLGPELWKKGKVHYEPLLIREPPMDRLMKHLNTIVLQPHCIYGREYIFKGSLEAFVAEHEATCHYVIYRNGREELPGAIEAIIYPDRVHKPGENRRGS